MASASLPARSVHCDSLSDQEDFNCHIESSGEAWLPWTDLLKAILVCLIFWPLKRVFTEEHDVQHDSA